MGDNVIEKKSAEFALRILKMDQYLQKEKHEYVLSKQVLRSGTSIGANVAEAQRGQTRADFHTKMCVAQKEAAETKYWLKLLYEGGFLTHREYVSISADAEDLLNILAAICKKTRIK